MGEDRPATLALSGRPSFPLGPSKRSDGNADTTVRFALKAGSTSWRPNKVQMAAIRKAAFGGTVYWRIETRGGNYAHVCGPTRALVLDTGAISGLSVSPSHIKWADSVAVWPNAKTPPTFQWTADTDRMKYFWV